MQQILFTYWPQCLICTCLVCFAVDFLIRFLIRGLRLRHQLMRCTHALKEMLNRTPGAVTDLDAIAAEVMSAPALEQSWREYWKTLHPQREPDAMGCDRVVRWCASTLAEVFFTEQSLVESPLGTNYFKHLPGVLTGLGIIGTLSGLTQGLLHFHVSSDSAYVEESLSQLMAAVGHAFYISGAAILLAMLVTFLEKLMTSDLYRKVENLQRAIDGLFMAGAEDEYLERIVKASETSATQAVQIKDALVADLKQILFDITAQQMAASAQYTNQMSADVGRALASTLEPISRSVEGVRASQSEAVSKLLVDVLASFSNEIREMFGGQMAASQELLQSTNQVMQATAGKFELLIEQSIRTSEAMETSAAKLAAATAESISKMNSGAEMLGEASSDLARTATRVAESLRLAGGTVDGMREAAESLSAASTTTRLVSEEYARSREVIARMASDLKAAQDNAMRLSGMPVFGELLEQIPAQR